ncbi:hypothetical protein A3K64_01495 [Candidatus Micrarchaeota archaeon RBG_16_36_9]|nr:MAG: hypothetical protein A3K64_01495 [Candidatus Micrarchaeota archaeon RBG_16_36_9]
MIILILLITFFLRVFLLIKNKWVGNDTFAYATYALEFKKKGHMIKIPDQMKPPYNDFVPQLFTAFLSLFPKKSYRYLQYLSPLLDLIIIILLYNFSLTFFGETAALIASFAYAITPIAVYSCFALGPRTFSNLFLTLAMLSLFFYFNGSSIFLLLFFISSAIILLSHRLTTQSLVTLTLAGSIAFSNVIPILALVAAAIFWLVTLRGTYVKILKTHYEKLSNYAKRGSYRDGKIKFESPIRLFSSFPFILFLIGYLIIFGSFNQLFLEVWFFSILALSFLWVLGDGFRYLDNAIFPGSILIGISVLKVPFPELVFFVFALISFGGVLKLIQTYQASHNAIKPGFIECCKFVRKNSKRSDVLVPFPWDYHYVYVSIFFADVNTIGGHVDYNEKGVSTTGKVDEYKVTWVITNNPSPFAKSRLYSQKFESKGFFVFKRK